MRAILAICRSMLVGALALGLTASPLCAAGGMARASTVRGTGRSHGAYAVAVVCSGSAAPSPTKVEAATDQGDGYDVAQVVGADASSWTSTANAIGVVVNSQNSRGGALPLHSLIAQRTCLRL